MGGAGLVDLNDAMTAPPIPNPYACACSCRYHCVPRVECLRDPPDRKDPIRSVAIASTFLIVFPTDHIRDAGRSNWNAWSRNAIDNRTLSGGLQRYPSHVKQGPHAQVLLFRELFEDP